MTENTTTATKSPFIYRRSAETVETGYEVYDRETGEHLTTVIKNSDMVYDKWESTTGITFRNENGRKVSPRGSGETRDQAVRSAIVIRSQYSEQG